MQPGDVAEAMSSLGDAVLEYKLDGARIQGAQGRRRGAGVLARAAAGTAAVPEVVEAVRLMPARSLILDGEVLALDPTGTRARSRTPCADSAAGSRSRHCARNSVDAGLLRRFAR
jgi:ATP-dependent DNA ligase